MRNAAWRLFQPFLVLGVITLIGVIGYMVIEDFTLVEAVYMTTISVTTAGFTEVRPLSEAGRMFTVFLLITSWCSFAFALTRITQYLINGEINQYFKTRRTMRSIDKLNDHVIICGFGRNGSQAAQTLGYHGEKFVVIENRLEIYQEAILDDPDMLIVYGDGTDDDILKKAGIEKAKALITALPLDAHNVFIVLSARSMNPGIQIISRASDRNTYPKLKKAGANSVIMPDKIGGTHMATLVSKPDVIEFIDYLSGEEGEAIHIESVSYDMLPEQIRDKSLNEIMSWKKTGVNCIGLKDIEGKFMINPPQDVLVKEGMKVLVLGTKQQIQRMKMNIGD
ncbi:MAG: potassium channel protein [Chitinophagaceae bacterium]|nr:potassium channel protein [Chitinophagaceae bacterium]